MVGTRFLTVCKEGYRQARTKDSNDPCGTGLELEPSG